MQPIKYLDNWLRKNANNERYLFMLQDLRGLYTQLSNSSFRALLSRAVSAGYLVRACRGVYIYKYAMPTNGLILFHIAALLRAREFNYISLETVLSDAGIISQIPLNTIFIMSSGRSNRISCGEFGMIEFIHTNQTPENLVQFLSYDLPCRLWRANINLALRDMKATRRNGDLIDWDLANELI